MSTPSQEARDEGGRAVVQLRPLCAADAEHIAPLLADTQAQHLLLAYPPQAGQPVRDVDQWLQRRCDGGDLIAFAIIDHNGGFCGFVQISERHRRGRFGWLGMMLSPQCRGRGLGGAALDLLMTRAAREFDLRKMLLQVRADNLPAIRLYRRRKFREVGTLASHYFDGAQHFDVIVMERFIQDVAE